MKSFDKIHMEIGEISSTLGSLNSSGTNDQISVKRMLCVSNLLAGLLLAVALLPTAIFVLRICR